MPSTVRKALDAVRGPTPLLVAAPLPRKVDEAMANMRGPRRPLATPPPGSDLRPVMGDGGLPLLGYSIEVMRNGYAVARRRYAEYGPVSWMSFLGMRMVGVAGPEATQTVLINKDKAFSQDGWVTMIDRFFHRGLMLLDFDEHLTHRRIMQEAFTSERLAGYTEQVGPCVREALPHWRTGEPFQIYPELKQLTLDIATRVFMDERSGAEADRVNKAFVDAVRAPTALLRAPIPGGRWRAGLQGRQVLERYFADNLPAKRRSNGRDLFSALCHATTPDGERFSDEDVINHMIFLMMAAHDTTTITTSAATYFLAKHPEWQQKAREESLALGDEPLDMAALDQLHTLDLVIKESLRLLAPVPTYMRRAVTDTEVAGHYIPKGMITIVSPAVNHFDPEYWTNPDEFDPDRFSEGRREDKGHRFAWLPFGGGVHKCIGLHFGTLEVKTLLHEMLRNYDWSVPADYEVRWDFTSLPIPVDGLPIVLSRR
ncbi:cytochrome P450 [Tamaricihabitans halophyticus]|uniref:Cytochrome P450 n=1 Tax=Tamaricihabitans halophyticus TaxID=1262583 RepID=A0A4R2QUI0_9PSEU|nr:cytochrome P450 [Tamaricihabitans halophyticus]TCP53652.1 cytochrome P450 [Tamaricihabitans halophyticus]